MTAPDAATTATGSRRPLGMNARNRHIARANSRRSIVEVKDKLLTKARLNRAGIPTSPTLAALDSQRSVRRFDWSSLPDAWVMKPARGSQGRGVVVVRGRRGDRWLVGRHLVRRMDLRQHALDIVDGAFSDDGDVVLVEPLLRPHPALADIAPIGLPDIRIVAAGTTALLAMMRLPTVESGGVGNLHQGGIGAAVDLDSGRIERALLRRREIRRHPDSGVRIVGRTRPAWAEIVDIARRVGAPTGLGYLGVDLVLDREAGPIVLEVNSHPGLEIQNVTGRPIELGSDR